jgi:hypothetical protein
MKHKNKPNKRRAKPNYIKMLAITFAALLILGVWGGLIIYIIKHPNTTKRQVTTSQNIIDSLAVKYSAPDTSFSANFPTNPVVTSSTLLNYGTQIPSYKYDSVNASNNTRYSVQTFTYPSYSNYIRDNQRQILQQLISQVNSNFSAKVVSSQTGLYLCGFSASREQIQYIMNRKEEGGYVEAALDYNNFYILENYGQNINTFSNFVKSFVPKGGCNY